MSLRWLCYLRIHSEERKQAPDRDGYYGKCRRCGRERDIRQRTYFGVGG